MRIQICFLLFLFVAALVYGKDTKNDDIDATADSALEKKKPTGSNKKKEFAKKRKEFDSDDDIEDHHFGDLASYADDRYSTYNSPASNFRTRQRWSTQNLPDDEASDLNDWITMSNAENTQTQYQQYPQDGYSSMNSRSTCSSLIDMKYPVFADTCGAVPQARYALPNAFGHRERWQVAQFLQGLIGSSNEPACLRSLRLLLCPMLFPPCASRLSQTPTVLPCQSYCRAVKNQCAIPALEFLPCEILPQSSEICPPIQSFATPAQTPLNPYSLPSHQGPWLSGNYPPMPQWSSGMPSTGSNALLNLLQYSQKSMDDQTRPNPIDQSSSRSSAIDQRSSMNQHGTVTGTQAQTTSNTRPAMTYRTSLNY